MRPGDSVPLERRLARLDEALELGRDRLDPEALEAAHGVRTRVEQRRACGEGLVVAALCGGTGTGKSSLFNRLAGADLAPVGVQRPTTDESRAWSAGGDTAAALLDWLGVRRRHVAEDAPEGLVLVDLPDNDSVAVDHRPIAEGVMERADVLVWVVDPLKYAHRVAHEHYLRRLADHAEVVVVVLNHADALSDDDRATVRDHLGELLTADGLAAARVVITSARTGEGVDGLRELLVDEASQRTAVAERLVGDVRSTAGRLRTDAGGPPGPLDDERAVAAVAEAVGVERVAEDAAGEYRRAARAATRPMIARLVMAVAAAAGRLVHGMRSLLPGTRGGSVSPAKPAPLAVRHAVLEVSEQLVGDLPPAARRRLREVAPGDGAALARALNDAVDRVRLVPPRRRWWPFLAFLLSLAELAAVGGAAWLTVLAAVAWLQLPPLPTANVAGELPWPTALLAGGVLGRVLLGLVRRQMTELGARRHRDTTARTLRDAAGGVARQEVVEPLRAEVGAWTRLQAALDEAAA